MQDSGPDEDQLDDPAGRRIMEELQRDLDEVGLPPGLFAMVLKRSPLLGLVPPIVLVPLAHIGAFRRSRSVDIEAAAIGLRESVALLRPLGPTTLLAESLLALARAAGATESLDVRMAWALEAIRILRDQGRRGRLARAYLDIGDMLKQAFSHYDALTALEIGIEFALDNDDPLAAAAGNYHRAVISRYLGLDAEALVMLETAGAGLADVPGPGEWAARVRSEAAMNLIALGRNDAALDQLDRWIAETPNLHVPWLLRGDLRRTLSGAAAGMPDHVRAAVAAAAEISTNASGRFRRSDRERLEPVFDTALSASIAADQPDLTFGLLELANSSSAVLARAHDELDGDDHSREVRDEIEAERDAVAAIAVDLFRTNRHDDLASLHARAEALVARADFLAGSGDRAAIVVADVASWSARVQEVLPQGTALLSFFTTADRAHVVATTHDEVVCRPTTISDVRATLLRVGFERECHARFPPDALAVLSASLLGPVHDIAAAAERIAIVPSQSLHGLPFHAMPFDGAPLGATRAVTYLTAGSELLRPSAGRTAATTWRALAAHTVPYAGLPDLPAVLDEIQRVAARFDPTHVEVSSPALADHLLSQTSHVDVLHVACHGDFDPRTPLLSRLMLADRPVFAFEILLSSLDVDHVVLTACDTATADAGRGGHVQSLAAAFLRAGAQCVVAALWPVDDAAAASCIDSFYEGLTAGGTPAEALSAAQNTLRSEQSTEHPAFWAPFAVFGAQGLR